MKKYHLLRCNQWRKGLEESGSCMGFYLHEDPKHSGPCLSCWKEMTQKQRYDAFLNTLAKNPREDQPLVRKNLEKLKKENPKL